MKTCCFCFDLRHGTIATAVFFLVTRILAVTLFSTILGLRNNDPITNGEYHLKTGNEEVPWYYIFEYSDTHVIIGIAENSIYLIFSLLLLIGAKQKNTGLFWPWMIFAAIEVFGVIGLILMNLLHGHYTTGLPRMCSYAIGAVLQFYMLYCVISYYKQLKERNNTNYYSVSANPPLAPQELTTSCNKNNEFWINCDQPPNYDKVMLIDSNDTSLKNKPPI